MSFENMYLENMDSNLSDHQLNIDCYMHRMLYRNLMVTINQKPCNKCRKNKEKGVQNNIKESHQIAREKSKRRRKEQKTTKTTRKQLTK